MSIEQVIPSGSSDNFNEYFSLLVIFFGFALGHVGETYPRLSFIETPLGTTELIALNLDGPVCVASSHRPQAEVHVYLFYGGVELGFWAFRFPLGIEEDMIGMLMNSSTIAVG